MTEVQFLYGRPDNKIKYYFVVSEYSDGKVFYQSSVCGGGITALEDFVNQVNRSTSKVVVLMLAKKDIEIVEEAFRNG